MLQASVVCQIKTWPTSLLSVMLPSASNIMHLPTVSFGYIGSLFACRDFSKQILHALAMGFVCVVCLCHIPVGPSISHHCCFEICKATSGV